MDAAIRWSPHSTGGDTKRRFLLVDVADQSLTLNQVDDLAGAAIQYRAISRYGRLPHFGAFAWSPAEEPIVALGLVSGNANLIRMREGKEPSETIATFKIKQQRKCNSVAFNHQNWLAIALDKTRSDACLNIYDTRADSLLAQEPIRRLCPAELVSSVRFFSSQPQEIIVAVQKSHIRLYDIRDGFSSGANAQVATKNGNNITIDPLDEHYFASAGSTDDPSVTVWDRRWLVQSAPAGSNNKAVFNFSPAVDDSTKTSVWSLRYSGKQRGRLAICSSNGELKVVDMVEGKTTAEHSPENCPVNPYGGSAWISNRYVSQTRSLERPFHHERHGREYRTRIIAFDWMVDDRPVGEQALICLRQNRGVATLRVSAIASQAQFTARSDLCVGLNELSLTEPRSKFNLLKSSDSSHQHSKQNGKPEDFGPRDYDGEKDRHEDRDVEQLKCQRDSVLVANLLADGTLPRERCRRGYLFDCEKNMNIVAGNWQLERLWEIVNRFKEQAAEEAMLFEPFDLSYVGVSGLWSENIGSNPNRKLSVGPAKINDSVCGLNAKFEFPPFDGERTEFPDHRQLCLFVCGWKFTMETLEQECQELIDRGLHYQAIVQAVLHEHKHLALNLLRTLIRSKTIPNIGLNALLACDEINDEQREMCLWMAADTQDPALKALLTFLTTGNWRDVMKTNYLHLGYRVALGLKYLNDTELSGFIQTETARAIKNGDLEGLLLTGMGEKAMDLFQTYIAKTNDLQSAVLATAFTNPRYVNDGRWPLWKETYFTQMQAWRAFSERTRFIVQHNDMCKTREGHSLLPAPEQQASLRCTHCQRPPLRMVQSTSASASRNSIRASGPAANAGTVCPRCGRQMPRCGICMLWLGTPDPSRSNGARELERMADMMAKFLTFCATCGHGFHADHARLWFNKHSVCPVSNCQCSCGLD